MSDAPNTRLPGGWTLWLHRKNDESWEVDSYVKVYPINSVEQFWTAWGVKNRNVTGVSDMINDAMYFFMRNGVMPRWEDPSNRNGGCLSVKIADKSGMHLIEDMVCMMLGETLSREAKDSSNITGISIVQKGRGIIVKIWLASPNLGDSTRYAIPPQLRNGVIFKVHDATKMV
jgi:hypothetical protein